MDDRKKVLVVEDEELAKEFLRFFLSKKFDVYTVGSVNTFYNIISNITFDLILMDISLHDTKDGLQLTRELKESKRHKNTPIFVITAFNTTKERTGAVAAGADKFITKPIDTKALLKMIEETLLAEKAS